MVISHRLGGPSTEVPIPSNPKQIITNIKYMYTVYISLLPHALELCTSNLSSSLLKSPNLVSVLLAQGQLVYNHAVKVQEHTCIRLQFVDF